MSSFTRGGSRANGKQRVLFVSHPQDLRGRIREETGEADALRALSEQVKEAFRSDEAALRERARGKASTKCRHLVRQKGELPKKFSFNSCLLKMAFLETGFAMMSSKLLKTYCLKKGKLLPS